MMMTMSVDANKSERDFTKCKEILHNVQIMEHYTVVKGLQSFLQSSMQFLIFTGEFNSDAINFDNFSQSFQNKNK